MNVESKFALVEEKGREEVAKVIVRNLISKGIAISTIADLTGLTESLLKHS
ncbi:MAG: hypothetical protein WAW61_17700 [Methylococcaceae bacterium]